MKGYLALEPRIMLDAAAAATAGAVDDGPAGGGTADSQAKDGPEPRTERTGEGADVASGPAADRVTPVAPSSDFGFASFAATALSANDVTVPDSQRMQEDGSLTLSGGEAIAVANANGEVSVDLGAGKGTLTLAQTTNLTSHSGDGTDSVSLTGARADVNAALDGLTYTPNADVNGSDTITVDASDDDGAAGTQSVDVAIKPVNDAPTLNTGSVTVAEGQTGVTVPATAFGLSDPDLGGAQVAQQEVFQLDGGNTPDKGTLKLDGNPLIAGSTFSLADLQNDNLTYDHDGADVQAGASDSFDVTVNDGGGSGDVGPHTVTIDLQPVNSAPSIAGSPSVFEGQGTEDEAGNPGTPTDPADVGASLSVTDEEQGHADALANSTIDVVSVDNDGDGTLYRDANANDALDTGEALSGGESFSADRLGELRFQHDGGEPNGTDPNVTLKVTDNGGGEGPGNELSSGNTTIDIAVKPNDDHPALDTNAGASVAAGGAVTITDGDLKVTDVEQANRNLVYEVTQVPTEGELQVNGNILGVGGRFTQQGIDDGDISYDHTRTVTGGATDSFTFQVRDQQLRAFNNAGNEGAIRDSATNAVKDLTFDITITGDHAAGSAPDGPSPGFGGDLVLDSKTVDGITVTEDDGTAGGSDTGGITQSELDYELDLDTNGGTTDVPPDETVYRLTSLPGNGDLTLAGTTLARYDTFTQADINDKGTTLEFVHDGSENHQDGFGFSVSAGVAKTFDDTFATTATPTNDAPTVSTADLPIIGEESTTRVTTSQIDLGDVDNAAEAGEPNDEAVDDPLFFRATDLPDAGTLERYDGTSWTAVGTDDLLSEDLLTADVGGETSGLRYVHDGTETFSDAFDVEVRDDLAATGDAFTTRSLATEGAPTAGNVDGPAKIGVDIAPLNDPPLADAKEDSDEAITKQGVTTVNEILKPGEGGTATITDDMHLQAVDSDNDTVNRQFRITDNVDHGTLNLNGRPIGQGATFTQQDIDNDNLTYTHDGTETFTDHFDFQVSDSVSDHEHTDGGGTGVTSRFDIVIDTASLKNDPPTLTASTDTLGVFGQSSIDLAGTFTVNDPDLDDVITAPSETDRLHATIHVVDSNGADVDLTQGGAGIDLKGATVTTTDGDLSDGDLAFKGTLADVRDGLTGFQVTLPGGDENDTFDLKVTVDDRLDPSDNSSGANGGSGNEDGTPINDANNTVTKVVTLQQSDDNDDPNLTVPADKTVNEDTTLDLNGDVQVSDVDSFNKDIRVDLSVSDGKLNVSGDAASSSLTLTGSESAVQSQLDTLTYRPDSNFFHDGGNDTVNVTVNDQGNAGAGGGGDITGSFDIRVDPVNDSPTVNRNADATVTLETGNEVVFDSGDGDHFTVGDANDNPASSNAPTFVDDQTVTIDASTGTVAGTLSLGGGPLPDTNGADNVVQIQGSLTDLNTSLDGLTFTPDNPNADGTATIDVTIDDGANGGTDLTNGSGGPLTASTSVTVNTSNTNESPSFDGTPDGQTVTFAEDTAGNAVPDIFGFTDGDDFGSNLKVTVGTNQGDVTLDGTTGDSVTVTATESALNTVLDGLTYTPKPDYHGGDTLSVTVDDRGNTGAGGPNAIDADVDVTVAPVNDRPTGADAVLTSVRAGNTDPPGATLASLYNPGYSDSVDDQTPDGGDTSSAFGGLAITGNAAGAKGTWQVSTDGGGSWSDAPDTPSDSAARVLPVNVDTRVRFLPANPNVTGDPGDLTVRLADTPQTDGTSVDLTAGGLGGTSTWSTPVSLETTVGDEVPSATDNSNSVSEGGPRSALGNVINDDDGNGVDVDPNGDDLTVSKIDGAAGKVGASVPGSHGAVTVQGNGSYTYDLDTADPVLDTLDTGQTLTDQFTYTIDDGEGGVASAILTVTINGLDDMPPTATDNTNTVGEGGPTSASGNVITDDDGAGVDSDPNGDSLTVTKVGGSAGNLGTSTDGDHGSVTVQADGGYSYALDSSDSQVVGLDDGETLTDSFTYAVDDGDGGSDQASLTITIEGETPAPPPPAPPANEPPVAADDGGRTPKNTPITFTADKLLDNDTDPDGGDLQVTGVGNAINGSVARDADGNFVFTPAEGFAGTGSFTYTIADPDGATARARVSIDVPAPPTDGDDDAPDGDPGDPGDPGDGDDPNDETPSDPGETPGEDPDDGDDGGSDTPPTDDADSGSADGGPDTPADSGETPADDGVVETDGPAAPPTDRGGGPGGDDGGTPFAGGDDADEGDGDLGGPEPDTGLDLGEGGLTFLAGDLPEINPVRLTASVEDRVMPREGVQEFSLPPNTFEHVDPTEEVRIKATRGDGSPLPNYIEFDDENQQFVINGDAADAAGVEQIGIRVTGRDSSRNEASTTFTIKFTDEVGTEVAPTGEAGDADATAPAAAEAAGEPGRDGADGQDAGNAPSRNDGGEPRPSDGNEEARAPAGKPSLNAQLAQTGRAAFLAERGDFLADIAAMFDKAA